MGPTLRPVDVLKVWHHGSRGSTSAEWLGRLRPALAVISVGRNDYGHPAPATVARRTDLHGSVSVTTDGRSLTVRGEDSDETYDISHDSLPTESGAACRHR